MKNLNVLAAVIAVLGVVFLISFLLNVTAYQFNLPEEAILLLITAVGFQGFLGYSNVHSSHLYSQHLISTMLWGLFQFGVLIFCTTARETMDTAQWLVSFSPALLSLVPPLFYSRMSVSKWAKPLTAVFLIYTLAVAYFLSGAGFYQIYCTLQMLIIALAVLNLKEQAQAQAV